MSEEHAKKIEDAQGLLSMASLNCNLLLTKTKGFFNRLSIKTLIGKIDAAGQFFENSLKVSSDSEKLREMTHSINALVGALKSCTDNASKYSGSESARNVVDAVVSNLTHAGEAVQWLIKDLKKG